MMAIMVYHAREARADPWDTPAWMRSSNTSSIPRELPVYASLQYWCFCWRSTSRWNNAVTAKEREMPSVGLYMHGHRSTITSQFHRTCCRGCCSVRGGNEICEVRGLDKINKSFNLVPIAIETCGSSGQHGWELIEWVGSKIAQSTGEMCATTFLRQRISIAIKKGISASVLGTQRHLMSTYGLQMSARFVSILPCRGLHTAVCHSWSAALRSAGRLELFFQEHELWHLARGLSQWQARGFGILCTLL